MYKIDTVFGADDTKVNGDILSHQVSNVVYDRSREYLVLIPYDMQTAQDPGEFAPLPTLKKDLLAFMILNLDNMIEGNFGGDGAQKVALCYYRFLAVKYRLMSDHYDAKNYFVDYNQVQRVADKDVTVDNLVADNDDGLTADKKHAASALLTTNLTAANFAVWNSTFINIVCTVAYMFRVRGHHYFPEMQSKYEQLWTKFATRTKGLGCTWEQVSTIGLHAIIPSVLDQFWLAMAAAAKCDGALIIRLNAFAAGTSSYNICNRGMTDLLVVFPQLEDRIGDAIQAVRDGVAACERNRWAHSINARFYGAPTDRLDEGPIGIIAALIRACVDGLAPESPLLESKALKRAANVAPISGAAYGKAINNYIKGEKFLAITSSNVKD